MLGWEDGPLGWSRGQRLPCHRLHLLLASAHRDEALAGAVVGRLVAEIRIVRVTNRGDVPVCEHGQHLVKWLAQTREIPFDDELRIVS